MDEVAVTGGVMPDLRRGHAVEEPERSCPAKSEESTAPVNSVLQSTDALAISDESDSYPGLECSDFSADDTDDECDADSDVDESNIVVLDEVDGQPKSKRRRRSKKKRKNLYKTSLIEKGVNQFEVLPAGWSRILHISGMPVYWHKATGVVTLSKPYNVEVPRNVKKHRIPRSAIPCLNYKKALIVEEASSAIDGDGSASHESGAPFPTVRLQSSNPAADRLTTNEVYSYCQQLFQFKRVLMRRKQEWGEFRQQRKLANQERIAKLSATCDEAAGKCDIKAEHSDDGEIKNDDGTRVSSVLPEGTHIISIPIAEKPKLNTVTEGNVDNKVRQKPIVINITTDMAGDGGPSQCPIVDDSDSRADRKRLKRQWIINPRHKTVVCLLHEYLQHAMRSAPSYVYGENTGSVVTPYSCQVSINAKHFGSGVGKSKKLAKSEAAKATLEMLIPELRGKLAEINAPGLSTNDHVSPRPVGNQSEIASDSQISNGANIQTAQPDLSFFDSISIEDGRVSDLCQRMGEPSPYTMLVTCLQRNYGIGDTSIKIELVQANDISTNDTPPGPTHRRNAGHYRQQLVLSVANLREARIWCRNKRQGKQIAAQRLLQQLHPQLKSWGALLNLYGSRAAIDLKAKREREAQVTALQSRHHPAHQQQTDSVQSNGVSPNFAIIAKLKSEMLKLAEIRSQALSMDVLAARPDMRAPGKFLPIQIREDRRMKNTCDQRVNL